MLALAALPRLLNLGRPGLTYDELYDLADSLAFCPSRSWTAPISDGYLNGQAPFFAACPLYGLSEEPELVARGLSVVAGLAAVAATLLLARRHLPARWGLLAGLLLGLSPFFVSASRLAFSHGHVFAVPWLVLALREVLVARPRLARPRAALLAGLLAGLAAGHDLLALPWALTLPALAAWRLARGRSGGRAAVAFAARFGLAWLPGLGLASPMYLASPLAAARDVAERLAWWGAQREHLWLGQEVEAVPGWYYALVLAVKLAPPVLVLAALAPLARRAAPARALLLCCWPVLYLSLRPWKSPFYLMPFLPLVFVLAVHALRRLARDARPGRRRLAAALAVVTVALQAAWLVDAHPDYLMLGARYSQRLAGDFQGPAVSHGQWVREALEWVRADAGGGDPLVVVPAGYAPRQVEHYAGRLGLSRVHDASQLKHGVSPRGVDYAIVSHEVLVHAEGRRQNAPLLRLVEEPGGFRLAASLRSSGFVTARVWRRVAPRPGPSLPAEAGPLTTGRRLR